MAREQQQQPRQPEFDPDGLTQQQRQDYRRDEIQRLQDERRQEQERANRQGGR